MLEPERRPGPRHAATTAASPAPARPGRGCPTSGSSPQAAAGRRRPAPASAASTGFELEPIVPAVEQWRYRNKLEYSFGERDGELALGFHARGRWDQVVDVEDCQLASERNNAARNEVRDWARRRGAPALRPPHERRACCATSSSARAAAPASCRPASSPRRPRSRAAGRPAHDDRGPGRRHRRARPACSATSTWSEELGGLRFRISHRAFFQTNTEMAERLYGIAAEIAGLTGNERVFDLYLRDRDHRPRARRARPARSGASRSSRRRSPTPSENARRNGIDNAHFRAGDARKEIRPLVERGGQARRRRRRPAARRPLEEDRPAPDRVRGAAHRLRLLQPDHARPERRPARRGRL